MTWSDWLLSLHVLSAFVLIAAMTVFWATVVATLGASSRLPGPSADAIARPAELLVGLGVLGTVVFGVWLAIDIDGYELWDGWILGSLVLWAIGSELGRRSGPAFGRISKTTGPEASAAYRQAVRLLAGSSIAYLLVLIMMIYKPGA